MRPECRGHETRRLPQSRSPPRDLAFTEGPRELPPRVEAFQDACDGIAPGNPDCAAKVCACQSERKGERAVDAPGLKASFRCRPGTKAGPRTETEAVADQPNHEKRQQRLRRVPVRSQQKLTDSAGDEE